MRPLGALAARVRALSLAVRVRALAEAALPDDAAPDEIAETVRRALDFVAGMPPPARALLHALLWHIEACPPETIGRPARFGRLPIADRRRVLDRWAASRLYARRAGAQALKGLCLLQYYAIPAVAARAERAPRSDPC